MIDLFINILRESWQVLNETAGYCLFGIFMAGLLRAFLPDDFVLRHLGKNDMASVVKASVIGVPMPVCSCGVMPVAMGLRRQGAGAGPTTAFMISTPESGIDSIAITWALLDPLMTVLRPLAAFITATVAGVAVNYLPEEKTAGAPEEPCACSGCGGTAEAHPQYNPGAAGRLREGLRFAFTELLRDIGPSLLLGILIAGAIAAIVPDGFIEQHLDAGFMPMLVMLAAGVPLYVCASASTPIVAALALKGLSPGAALVFLLAGPATNAATLMVVARLMGRRIAAVYVAVIAVVALLLGLAANYLYGLAAIDITGWIHADHFEQQSPLAPVFSVILVSFILKTKLPKLYKKVIAIRFRQKT
ncbi:MAG: SO_0444 family Cu/Zn efflux transporter [Deltaproteobacteria bacterium]|nr:SO_0444 family Cu/Zn efflux transporter [Deltaproteobacteria bacterium]